MTLPLSKPLMANSLAMMGVAVPRKLRRGTCCSTCHNSLPLAESSPCSRPSTERRTTTFSLIAGADSNSELTCARQRSRPFAASRAMTAPLLEPKITIPDPAAGPADRGSFSFLTQTCLPVSRVTARTSPLCEAANTTPSATAGPKPNRSLTCFLPPPTLSPHSFLTGNVPLNLSNAAGGSTSLSFEQPAAINNAAESQREEKTHQGLALFDGSAVGGAADKGALRSANFSCRSPESALPASPAPSAAWYSFTASWTSCFA